MGHISKTLSDIRCQFWNSKYPKHEVAKEITDDLFPDGDKARARNKCRNPGGIRDEPWCYTVNSKVIDDICGIPFCRYHECRLTGPGVEYAGTVKHSASDRECLSWKHKHREKHGGPEGTKFPKSSFPEYSRRRAKHYCRNPDEDPGGPWCYVEPEEDEESGQKEEHEDYVERDYCDIPFCDELDCMTYTSHSGSEVYSHWTEMNSTLGNMNISVKLWSPAQWPSVKLRLALSAVPLPATAAQLQDWGVGVEFTFTNSRSGTTAAPQMQKRDFVPTPALVLGTRWTPLRISWSEGVISVTQENSQVLFASEYSLKKGLPVNLAYYSVMGDGALWNIPFCDIDCEVHTISATGFPRFWPLRRTTATHDVGFYLRAKHSAFLQLRVSPAVTFPNIRVILSSSKNLTEIQVQMLENTNYQVVGKATTATMLKYWEWHEFTLSVFGDTLTLFWTRDVGTQAVLSVRHQAVRRMRWYSPGSLRSTSHWTFNCPPDEHDQVKMAVPPECTLEDKDAVYTGTQWVSTTALPCLLWVDKRILPATIREDSLFPEKSAVQAMNYCRNPTNDPQGPFCFVVDEVSKLPRKEHCTPRKCTSAECRLAGTGNDYVGKLNVTRSNRKCQQWTVNFPHQVNPTYLNDSLFPEGSAAEARNFCRNPSRNIAGSWCYTTDPIQAQDTCDVRDCSKPEECIAMTKGVGEGRLVYILNEWRTQGLKFWLKNWDPDLSDGIAFIVRPLNGTNYYKLIIGAKDNEKVQLFYNPAKGKVDILLKEKTLPHLIPIGKWGGFWLRIQSGHVALGYEGLENQLFAWTHVTGNLTREQQHQVFRPMFLTYTSVKGNTIGVTFQCHECHTEKTSTDSITKILSLGLHSQVLGGSYKNFTLYLRGTGVAVIPLMKLPGAGAYYALTIGDLGDRLYFIWQEGDDVQTVTATRIREQMFYPDKWTEFFISYNESNIEIKRNGRRILKWKHNKPLLFYWFSVGVENGEITWSVNCKPVDVDGAPRNGEWTKWSSWTCSVTCGGGEGIKTRTCTNPPPNIYGESCVGEAVFEGPCNTFECGEISSDTEELVDTLLRNHHTSLEVREGEHTKLHCNKKIVSRIHKESPQAKFKWTLNGMELHSDLKENTTVVVENMTTDHSGVYLCIVERLTGVPSVITVVSVAVKSRNATLSTRQTYSITLKCHGEALGYIYADLSQRWEVNGNIYKDYGVTTVSAVASEEIDPVNVSHNGEWKCIISQDDLGFHWITNVIIVEGFSILPGGGETCCPGLGCFSNQSPWRTWKRPIPSVDCQDVVRVYFLLFTRENAKVPFNITSFPNFTLDGSHFDASRQTVFFTHGWTAKTKTHQVYQLKDATLSSNDTNVILVDWSASSGVNYLQAVSNLRVVAAQIVSLIRFMMEDYGLKPENVKLIGHSLGAHASAYVGQSIPHIGWITGLDPAGPLFQGFDSKDIQLSSDDADYVDVIHTDILLQFPFMGFGESIPIGHKDFYINKGMHQPGCFSDSTEKVASHFWNSFTPFEDISNYMFCSHSRALDYYTDAFRYTNCTYWGQKDTSNGNVCTIDTCAPFGPCSKYFPATGSFLVLTRGSMPYCDPNVEVDKKLADIYNTCIKTASPADYQQGALMDEIPYVLTY